MVSFGEGPYFYPTTHCEQSCNVSLDLVSLLKTWDWTQLFQGVSGARSKTVCINHLPYCLEKGWHPMNDNYYCYQKSYDHWGQLKLHMYLKMQSEKTLGPPNIKVWTQLSSTPFDARNCPLNSCVCFRELLNNCHLTTIIIQILL